MYLSGMSPSLPREQPSHQSWDIWWYSTKLSPRLNDNSRGERASKSNTAVASITSGSVWLQVASFALNFNVHQIYSTFLSVYEITSSKFFIKLQFYQMYSTFVSVYEITHRINTRFYIKLMAMTFLTHLVLFIDYKLTKHQIL